MNWLSSRGSATLRRAAIVVLALLAACGAPASEPEQATGLRYKLHYSIELLPGEQTARVELELSQNRHLLREMVFDGSGIEALDGDGEIAATAVDGRARWLPPRDGGRLRWRVAVPHARGAGGYDAWLDESFGLFRAEDLIPRASTRTLRGAASETTFAFEMPPGWSVVTQYRERDGRMQVTSPTRRFVQPSGWIVAGRLGVRRDRIAGVRVTVAAPQEHGARRIDMLALLNWSLPELLRVFPDAPERLTIVSAGAPMWRGGLSGPASVYIHAERPLISENGTSTLLHEVAHVLIGARAASGMDWIVEGLAEYYSLEALRRSGTLTQRRYEAALDALEEWSGTAGELCGDASGGARTALAVTRLRALDVAVRTATADASSLDDVVRQLLTVTAELDLEALQAATLHVAGEIPDALHIDKLPGCRNIPAASQAP